ncbi:MAG: HAD-IA family hydrolase [Bacteroidetes bacterium]|nr:HAD-IA family hydrolase [Bacteroidota bacterium]MCY4204269.1 HAD-IA family hydrolase [Bacteroidota bacterium]
MILPLTCDAILFDLDGVLIDSNHIYEKQWSIWAGKRGISYPHIQKIHHGRPVTETIRIVAPHLDPYEEAEAYRDGLLASNDLEHVHAFPGVASLLNNLPPSRWAIATSAPRPSALQMLRHVALPVPNVFISGDDIGRGKPAPYPYLRAAWGLNQQIDRCVVIEDAPAGIQSGQSAGAKVIAVQTTNHPNTLIKADLIIDTIADLHIEDAGTYLRISVNSKEVDN